MLVWVAKVLPVVLFPCAGTAQIAALRIKTLEGEGAVHAPGSRSVRPFAAQVTDDTGRPVAGAAVTLHLPDEGPGGSFANGLRTEMVLTDANGRAAVRNIQWNRTPGQLEIRILVVKDNVRAGAVSSQFIAEAGPGGAQVRGKSHRKWLAIALLAAGAAGGAVIGARGGAASTAGGSPQTPAASPPVSIGTPTITVGKP